MDFLVAGEVVKVGYFSSFFWEFKGGDWCTLQGTNISPKNGILKMIFLFPRWDMLISWRVYIIYTGWWQLKYFLFSPRLFGEMIQFDWYFSNGLKPPTSTCIFLDGNWWFPYIPWWIGVWVYLVGVRIPNHQDTMRSLQKCLLIVFSKLNDVWNKTFFISCQTNTCFYYPWKQYDWVKWTWRFLFPR